MSPRQAISPFEPGTRTLPDLLTDEFIARIFTGQLAPNERLPPERALAEELGVDRTSLRVALRQLSRMNLVRAVQGSGITVLDFRRHAGIEFMAAVLEIPGLELGGIFLMEALDRWNEMLPRLSAAALGRATPAHLAQARENLDAQVRLLDAAGVTAWTADPPPSDEVLDELTELDVQMQDVLADVLGDVPLRLVVNSTRGIRRKLTRLQFQLASARAQVETHRNMFNWVTAAPVPAEVLIAAHAASLRTQNEAMRAYILTLPQQPYRTTSWTRPPR